MAFDKKKFAVQFAGEAREHVAGLNEGLLKLERDPADGETLNLVFRVAHTIKGSSRVVGLTPIAHVAHKIEDSLDALREKRIQPSKDLFNLLFKAIDLLSEMLDRVQAGQEIDVNGGKICEELDLAAQGGAAAPSPAQPRRSGTAQPSSRQVPSSAPEKQPGKVETPASPPDPAARSEKTGAAEAGSREETVRIPIARLDQTIKLMGEIVSNHNRMKQALPDLAKLGELSARLNELAERLTAGRRFGKGELENEVAVIAKELDANSVRLNDNAKDALSIQSLLTEEFREKVLRMRMLPLSVVWDAFPRLVRDMSTSLGKEVDFIMEGGETELDKKIIEKIGDPLQHIVRNCFDHGIEPPEERIRTGKPMKGVIKLSARYEGGNALIEVADDGAGIPIGKIKERALARKLFDEDTLNAMSASEIVNLIFRPGFSTSTIITDISGRGVGMDVARENIVEKLKGSIQIQTEEGRGTAFTIRLPVTLAIVRVLFAAVSDLKVSIATSSIDEIVKVSRGEIIDVVNKRAVRLREQIIPVLSLDKILELPEKESAEKTDVYILILSQGKEKLGAIVDTLISGEDIALATLRPHMQKNELAAGATLVGRDEVVVLLHAPKLFALAKTAGAIDLAAKYREEEKKNLRILVVDDSLSTREIEKSILESYGYSVDLASDGVEGLEKAMESKYDLVITDVEMPRMDGFSLTERLRGESGYKHTPIIIVTSRDKEEDKRRGIQVGANAYIVKGRFDQSNLIETVQNLVE